MTWKWEPAPVGTWQEENNVTDFVHFVLQEEGLAPNPHFLPTHWRHYASYYALTSDTILRYGGLAFPWEHHASPYHFVKHILPPEAPLHPWLFLRVPTGFWNDSSQVDAFFGILCQEPPWQDESALKQMYYADFEKRLGDYGGTTLFRNVFEGKRALFLKRLEKAMN